MEKEKWGMGEGGLEEIPALYEKYLLGALDRLMRHAEGVAENYKYREAEEALALARKAKKIAEGVFKRLPDVIKWASEVREKRAIEAAERARAKIEEKKSALVKCMEEHERAIARAVEEEEPELRPLKLLDELGGLVNTAALPLRVIIGQLSKIIQAEQDGIFWETAKRLEAEGKIRDDEDYIINYPKALAEELEKNKYFKAAYKRSRVAEKLYRIMDLKFQLVMSDFMVASEKLYMKVEKIVFHGEEEEELVEEEKAINILLACRDAPEEKAQPLRGGRFQLSVLNGYEIREELKKAGYRFNWEVKQWQKGFSTKKELAEEVLRLANMYPIRVFFNGQALSEEVFRFFRLLLFYCAIKRGDKLFMRLKPQVEEKLRKYLEEA